MLQPKSGEHRCRCQDQWVAWREAGWAWKSGWVAWNPWWSGEEPRMQLVHGPMLMVQLRGRLEGRGPERRGGQGAEEGRGPGGG